MLLRALQLQVPYASGANKLHMESLTCVTIVYVPLGQTKQPASTRNPTRRAMDLPQEILDYKKKSQAIAVKRNLPNSLKTCFQNLQAKLASNVCGPSRKSNHASSRAQGRASRLSVAAANKPAIVLENVLLVAMQWGRAWWGSRPPPPACRDATKLTQLAACTQPARLELRCAFAPTPFMRPALSAAKSAIVSNCMAQESFSIFCPRISVLACCCPVGFLRLISRVALVGAPRGWQNVPEVAQCHLVRRPPPSLAATSHHFPRSRTELPTNKRAGMQSRTSTGMYKHAVRGAIGAPCFTQNI